MNVYLAHLGEDNTPGRVNSYVRNNNQLRHRETADKSSCIFQGDLKRINYSLRSKCSIDLKRCLNFSTFKFSGEFI